MEVTRTPMGRSGQIGQYRVVTTIGVGGMAEVLKVQDTRTGQYRAIKIHFSPTEDEAVFLRYRREQRALARCDHPNVVKAYEYGVHEGRPYLVMEFVQGVPLTRFLEERDLTPGTERDKMACLLGIQIASALDHIHTRHLVHCDLKPDNILVTSDEIVKLVDFGITLDLGQEGAPTGDELVGTYAFCSPEQVSGTPLDHRSDLYSLGVVFYLLITGKLPFVAENAIGYIFRHTSAPPEPPEQYYPQIPSALKTLISLLLEKRPLDRPQSGRDVEQTLKRYVEGLLKEQQRARLNALEAERSQTSDVRLFEPAFVGRSWEKRQLDGSLTLLQAGSSGLALLLGEVGIGKSRLMDEALAEARARGLTVYLARCLPEADRPYQDIQELMEVIVATLTTADILRIQNELAPHLPFLARAFPATSRLLPAGLPPVPDADPRIELERVKEALRAFLDAVLKGPTVLALKDLQWADHTTLSLLGALSLEPRAENVAPALWLGSVSTDELAEEHPLQLWIQTPPLALEMLTVRPLDENDVADLVRSMLGGRLELGKLARELQRVTRGNPLFIVETVKELAEAGALEQCQYQDGSKGWRLAGFQNPEVEDDEEFSDDELSDESLESGSLSIRIKPIKETLADRLNRLSEKARNLLEYVAVLARPFSYEWLRTLTELPEETVLDILDELLGRRVLVERKGRTHNMFSFSHPAIAEVLLERISPLKRPPIHLKVAEVWLQVHGADEPGSVGLLSTHFYQGGAYAQAAPYLLHAAEGRLQLGLYQPAAKLLELATECCQQAAELDPRIKVFIHLRMGLVLLYLGEAEPTIAALRQAFQEAQAMGQLELQGQAVSLLARLASRQGDYVTSCRQFAEALRIQRDCQDSVGMLRSLQGLAAGLWFLGDLVRARKLFEESVSSARRLGDIALLSHGINGLGMVAQHDGRFSEAHKLFSEAAAFSREGARDIFYLLCQLNEADTLRQMGYIGQARSQLNALTTQLQRHGDREVMSAAHNLRAAIALDLRELDQAERELVRSGELLQTAPQHYTRAVRQLLVGELELYRGHPVEAQLGLSEALTLAEGRQYRELLTRALRFMAMALMQSGNGTEGLALLRRAIGECERIHSRPGAAEARLFLAEALCVQGERAEAQSLLDQVIPELQSMDMRLLLVRALVLRGRLAMDGGQPASASGLLEQALGMTRDIRSWLSQGERASFDTRPEIRALGVLWRTLATAVP